MSTEEENSGEKPGGIVKQTIDSVTGLAKAVPIYEDALAPVAKETGKALCTVGKAVNMALAPLSAMIWGYDKVKVYLEQSVSEKLQSVAEGDIQTPNPSVAGPAIEALRFAGHDKDLRELFSNLIATSIDKSTALNAHPAFVDIIKSLSADEAKILRALVTESEIPAVDVKINFKKKASFSVIHRHVTTIGSKADCTHPELVANYLDNLDRLGLIEKPNGRRKNGDEHYADIMNLPMIISLKNQLKDKEEVGIGFDYMYFSVTALGKQFIKASVIDKTIQ